MSELHGVVGELSAQVGKLSGTLADFQLSNAKMTGELRTEIAVLKQRLDQGAPKTMGLQADQWRPLIIQVVLILGALMGLKGMSDPYQSPPPPVPTAAP
jgi:hypothetical protein